MNGQWHPDEIRRIGDEVTRWVAEFYGSLEHEPITPGITPAAADALFEESLPAAGAGFAAAFAEMREKVVPNSLRIPHPRYFGLMNPTPVMPAIFTEVVVSALNQNMGPWSHSPAATAVEKRVIRWFCDLVGYPEGAFGTLCSGGSVANLIGLRLAIADRLPGSLAGGLQALKEPPVFYVSSEAHFSFRKSTATLGLGTDALRAVPVDARSRMDLNALREMIHRDRAEGKRPFALVGIAGTTSSGAVDPLEALAGVAQKEDCWYHIDAAWGSGILLSTEFRDRLRGIDRADSITFDPHKWLFMPMGTGAILTRDRGALLRTFETQAVYIPTDQDERIDFRNYGLVGSKRFDALKLWISFKALGADWYEATIDRHMALTRWLVEQIEAEPDWEIVVPPDLNILCFRYRPAGTPEEALPALQQAVVDAVVRDGRNWISTTVVNGIPAIRWMALSPALSGEDMHVFWDTLRELAPAAQESAPG